jgi:Ca2+-dependent lipid-binding protein
MVADPYVKVELVHEGRRVKKKKKTKTARNTLNPVYNEEIVFDVPSDSIHDVAISVQIFDYDR